MAPRALTGRPPRGLCPQIMQLLTRGNRQRTQEPTAANRTSSRSHAVLQVTVRQQGRGHHLAEGVRVGRLFLVDLAGSERASQVPPLTCPTPSSHHPSAVTCPVVCEQDLSSFQLPGLGVPPEPWLSECRASEWQLPTPTQSEAGPARREPRASGVGETD